MNEDLMQRIASKLAKKRGQPEPDVEAVEVDLPKHSDAQLVCAHDLLDAVKHDDAEELLEAVKRLVKELDNNDSGDDSEDY